MIKPGDYLSVILPKENLLAMCNIDLLIEVKKFYLIDHYVKLFHLFQTYALLIHYNLPLGTVIVPSLFKLIFIFFLHFQIDLFKFPRSSESVWECCILGMAGKGTFPPMSDSKSCVHCCDAV